MRSFTWRCQGEGYSGVNAALSIRSGEVLNSGGLRLRNIFKVCNAGPRPYVFHDFLAISLTRSSALFREILQIVMNAPKE